MEKLFGLIKTTITSVFELLVGLASVAVLVEVVFGVGPFGLSVLGNVVEVIGKLGSSGFVGLIATLVLMSLLSKK
jgi:hypothetical protein